MSDQKRHRTYHYQMFQQLTKVSFCLTTNLIWLQPVAEQWHCKIYPISLDASLSTKGTTWQWISVLTHQRLHAVRGSRQCTAMHTVMFFFNIYYCFVCLCVNAEIPFNAKMQIAVRHNDNLGKRTMAQASEGAGISFEPFKETLMHNFKKKIDN